MRSYAKVKSIFARFLALSFLFGDEDQQPIQIAMMAAENMDKSEMILTEGCVETNSSPDGSLDKKQGNDEDKAAMWRMGKVQELRVRTCTCSHDCLPSGS